MCLRRSVGDVVETPPVLRCYLRVYAVLAQARYCLRSLKKTRKQVPPSKREMDTEVVAAECGGWCDVACATNIFDVHSAIPPQVTTRFQIFHIGDLCGLSAIRDRGKTSAHCKNILKRTGMISTRTQTRAESANFSCGRINTQKIKRCCYVGVGQKCLRPNN